MAFVPAGARRRIELIGNHTKNYEGQVFSESAESAAQLFANRYREKTWSTCQTNICEIAGGAH